MTQTDPEITEAPFRAKRRWLLPVCLMLAILLLVAVMILGYRRLTENMAAQIQNAYSAGYQAGSESEQAPPPEPQIVEIEVSISAEIIKDGLRDLGELVTQEYDYMEVDTVDKAHAAQLGSLSFQIPFTKASYIYSYDGVIKAGIDFTQIDVEKDDGRKEITVTLPRARILSHELVDGSFVLYDEKQNILNPFSIEDFDASNTELKAKAEQKAIGKGLLTKADENAKNILVSFLQSGYNLGEYRIAVNWSGT